MAKVTEPGSPVRTSPQSGERSVTNRCRPGRQTGRGSRGRRPVAGSSCHNPRTPTRKKSLSGGGDVSNSPLELPMLHALRPRLRLSPTVAASAARSHQGSAGRVRSRSSGVPSSLRPRSPFPSRRRYVRRPAGQPYPSGSDFVQSGPANSARQDGAVTRRCRDTPNPRPRRPMQVIARPMACLRGSGLGGGLLHPPTKTSVPP